MKWLLWKSWYDKLIKWTGMILPDLWCRPQTDNCGGGLGPSVPRLSWVAAVKGLFWFEKSAIDLNHCFLVVDKFTVSFSCWRDQAEIAVCIVCSLPDILTAQWHSVSCSGDWHHAALCGHWPARAFVWVDARWSCGAESQSTSSECWFTAHLQRQSAGHWPLWLCGGECCGTCHQIYLPSGAGWVLLSYFSTLWSEEFTNSVITYQKQYVLFEIAFHQSSSILFLFFEFVAFLDQFGYQPLSLQQTEWGYSTATSRSYCCMDLKHVNFKISTKLQVFINSCLQDTRKIWGPEKINNRDLWARAKQDPIARDIARRKWRWKGCTPWKPSGAPHENRQETSHARPWKEELGNQKVGHAKSR